MKRVLLALCLALGLVGTVRVAAMGDQDFRLVNKTGWTFEKVFVSPSNSKRWGSDVMGRDVLEDGEAVRIRFSRDEEECLWDLKVVDKNGDSEVWSKLNLCKAREITLKYEHKKATAIIK